MKKIISGVLIISMAIFFYSCINNRIVIPKSKKVTKRYSYVNNIKDTTVILPLLKVKENAVYAILDSVIAFNNSCIYTVMKEKVWFRISSNRLENDMLIIYLNGFQYCDNNVCKINENYFGVFYYKDFLFSVSNSHGLLDVFFEQTELKKEITTSYSNTIYYLIQPCKECYAYDQYVALSYHYIDDQFKLFHKTNNCTEYYPICHKIRKNDSMGKIVAKYGVTEYQIMKLNNLKEPILPNKGKLRIQ